ncbi:MAG: PAS domain S-box protein [Bacteroidia bacterium]|nr:PAS domain S-box protein [Bacteroidia bacterium]
MMNIHPEFDGIINIIPDLLFEVDNNGTILNYHSHSAELLVSKPEDIIGKTFFELLPPHSANICQMAINEALEIGISTGMEYMLSLPQGDFWFGITVSPLNYDLGQIRKYVFLVRDITIQKQNEIELKKINRIHAIINQINNLIIRAKNRLELFEGVCKIACDFGGFRMSWISIINNETNIITPLTYYGYEHGYLEAIQKISVLNKLFGKGPTSLSALKGKPFYSNNIATDSIMEPWREEALKRGYLSAIALPIKERNITIGTLNLYASEIDFFSNSKEIELLESISENMSFLLNKLLDEEDQIQAKELLLESEQKFKLLLNSTAQGIYGVDLNGICTFINTAGLKKLGYSEEEILGKNIHLLIHHSKVDGSKYPPSECKIYDVLNNPNGIHVTDECFWNKNGHSFLIEYWSYPMMINGKTIGSVASFYDITERKQEEELLLRNSQLLEESQSLAKVGGWELDLVLDKLYWTAETYRIHETTPQEFDPTVDAGVGYFLPESKQIITEALAQAINNGIGYDLLLETYTTKGNKINIRTTCAVSIEKGKPVKLTGIFQDITELKRVENEILLTKEKAEESKNKLKVMVTAMPDLVWYKDQHGVYLECNQRFEDFIGFAQDQLIGKTDQDIFETELADLFILNDKAAILSGEPNINEEEITFANDGHSEYLETIKTPVFDSNNQIIGVLGIGRNITVRKESEILLQKKETYLQAILQSTADGILAVNSQHEVIYYNKQFENLWNIPADLINKKDDEILLEFVKKQLIDPDTFISKVHQLYESNDESLDTLFFKDGKIIERYTHSMVFGGILHGRVWSFRNITEKRKAEIEKEKNISTIRKLSHAIEQSPVTTVITDLNGNIVFINAKFTEITGYTESEVLGKNPSILNTGHTSKLKYNDLWQTILGGNSWHGEFKNKKKNGDLYWERAVISPVKDSNGKITNFLAVKEDITIQKIADEAFKKNTKELEDYKFAIDETAIVSITNSEGEITYVNNNFCNISKYSIDELVGQNHRIIKSNYHNSEYFENMWSLITTGKVWIGQICNKAKDGSLYWLHGTIIPFLDDKNKPFQYLSIRFDVTELKKAEVEILQSNEKYNLVAKATNDSIWDLNILSKEIVRSGNGYEILFGYNTTNGDFNLSSYLKLIHPDDLDRVISSKNKAYNNKNEFNWEQDYRFLKANGHYAFVHDKGLIIRDKNGKAIRMIGATQDVTDREKYIKAIEDQNIKLKDIAWLQSHVVRAPLSRMMGIVNLLKEVELNGEEFKEWLGHFVNSSAELDKVIHDISNKRDEYDLKFKK